MSGATRRGPRTPAAALLYASVAVVLFAHAWASPGDHWMGSPNDPPQHLWFLVWTPWALTHLHDPFVTTHLHVPGGDNLMWNPLMPLAGLVLWPVTATAGPVAAYNLLAGGAVVLTGLAARAAFLRLTGSAPGALAGGLFVAVSPFVVAQAHGHVDLVLMAFPALVLLLLHGVLVRGDLTPRRTGLGLGLAAVGQLLFFEETLAAAAVAAGVGVAVLALMARDRAAAGAAVLGRTLAWALAVFVPLASVPLAIQLVGPQRLDGQLFPSSTYSADLLGPLVPTSAMAVAPGPLLDLSNRFPGGFQEWDAYVGLPLLVVSAWLLVTQRADRVVRWAAVSAATLFVLSLGPVLHVAGVDTHVPLPWAVADRIPLLQDLLPARLAAEVDLCMGALVAVAVARLAALPRQRRTAGWLVTAACGLALLPRTFAASTVAVPAFFTNGDVQRLPEGSVALVVPLPNLYRPGAMLWQARAGMWFRMVGGYTVGHLDVDTDGTELGRRLALVAEHQAVPALDDATVSSLRADLARRGVDEVILGPTDAHDALRGELTRIIGREPVTDAGVELWAGVRQP